MFDVLATPKKTESGPNEWSLLASSTSLLTVSDLVGPITGLVHTAAPCPEPATGRQQPASFPGPTHSPCLGGLSHKGPLLPSSCVPLVFMGYLKLPFSGHFAWFLLLGATLLSLSQEWYLELIWG